MSILEMDCEISMSILNVTIFVAFVRRLISSNFDLTKNGHIFELAYFLEKKSFLRNWVFDQILQCHFHILAQFQNNNLYRIVNIFMTRIYD
jgi:hypothetical protein